MAPKRAMRPIYGATNSLWLSDPSSVPWLRAIAEAVAAKHKLSHEGVAGVLRAAGV